MLLSGVTCSRLLIDFRYKLGFCRSMFAKAVVEVIQNIVAVQMLHDVTVNDVFQHLAAYASKKNVFIIALDGFIYILKRDDRSPVIWKSSLYYKCFVYETQWNR